MSRYVTRSLARLIEELRRLPGIGTKSAERIALHILGEPETKAQALAKAILELKEKVILCKSCFNYTEETLCQICQDSTRLQEQICVVERARDVQLFESAGGYHGLYHVLHGVLAPLEGIGPNELKVNELVRRVEGGGVNEVVMATSPTIEGEATALYLQRRLQPTGVSVSRIAYGLPVGSDLDYVDMITLSRSLAHRKQMDP